MKQPLVSIIIPCYNAEKFFLKCYEGIRAQTYQNIEIVVVENGRNKGVEKIVKSIGDKRIKYFYTEIPNVSNARNLGIRKSNGKYICFVDVDDYLMPKMIETFVNRIKEDNTPVAVCEYFEEYSNGSRIIKEFPWDRQILNEKEIKDKYIPLLIGYGDGRSIFGAVWRLMIERRVLFANKIAFNSDVSIGEDLLFTLELLLCINKISLIKLPLYVYQRNSGSLINSYKSDVVSMSKKYHFYMKKCLEKFSTFDLYKENYNVNLLRMYPNAISFAVRSGNIQKSFSDINKVYEIYMQGDCDLKNNALRLDFRIVLFLLEHKYIKLLYVIFYIKEKIRISKLSNSSNKA